MNWLDWIILFVLALTAFSGIRHGLSPMLAVARKTRSSLINRPDDRTPHSNRQPPCHHR